MAALVALRYVAQSWLAHQASLCTAMASPWLLSSYSHPLLHNWAPEGRLTTRQPMQRWTPGHTPHSHRRVIDSLYRVTQSDLDPESWFKYPYFPFSFTLKWLQVFYRNTKYYTITRKCGVLEATNINSEGYNATILNKFG